MFIAVKAGNNPSPLDIADAITDPFDIASSSLCDTREDIVLWINERLEADSQLAADDFIVLEVHPVKSKVIF